MFLTLNFAVCKIKTSKTRKTSVCNKTYFIYKKKKFVCGLLNQVYFFPLISVSGITTEFICA